MTAAKFAGNNLTGKGARSIINFLRARTTGVELVDLSRNDIDDAAQLPALPLEVAHSSMELVQETLDVLRASLPVPEPCANL